MDRKSSGAPDDAERQEALAAYDVLDTPPEVEFDNIVRMASHLCGVPVALISLLDRGRQWFKAEIGFGASETPITSSICVYTAQQNDVFVIPDATKDPRTAQNPLVTSEPHVRFYAGVPLTTPDGVSLGALCVLDTKPNSLTEEQAFGLRTLANCVMTELGLRRALKERRESDLLNGAILDSAIDYAIISMDLDGSVKSWQGGSERIFGWTEKEMIGQHAHVFFTDQDRRDRIPEQEMGNALRHGKGTDERWHRRKDGSQFWANGEMMPLKKEDGTPDGFIKILRDRTQQRIAAEALAQSEARFRSLFTGMQEGFYLGELIRDANGRPVDYRFLEINPAFVAQSGLPADCVGQTVRSLLPDIPQSLIDTYAHTVDTGEAQSFEIEVPRLSRWFEVRSHKDAGERFAVLFLDITARKLTEARGEALAALGDRLRDLSDRDDIAAASAEIVGRCLELSQAGYGAVDLDHQTITVTRDWSDAGLDRKSVV